MSTKAVLYHLYQLPSFSHWCLFICPSSQCDHVNKSPFSALHCYMSGFCFFGLSSTRGWLSLACESCQGPGFDPNKLGTMKADREKYQVKAAACFTVELPEQACNFKGKTQKRDRSDKAHTYVNAKVTAWHPVTCLFSQVHQILLQTFSLLSLPSPGDHRFTAVNIFSSS